MNITSNKGIVSFDLVRGLAAYFVFVFHFFLLNNQGSELYEFITIFCVEIFFILSGFVLGRQLDLCYKNGDFKTLKVFYLRRWMRTIPIFIFILVLSSTLNNDLLSSNFFSYLFFYKYFFNFDNDYFFTLWSLSIEEIFYLTFPIILIIGKKLLLKKLNIIFTVIIFFFFLKIFYLLSDLELVNFRRFTLIRLDSILFGYFLYIGTDKLKKYFNHINLNYLLSFLLLGVCFYNYLNKNHIFYVYSAHLASVALIISFYKINIFFNNKAFLSKFSGFLSNTSYCIYLSHLFIFQFLKSYLSFDNSNYNFILYISLTILFSIFSFYIIERPFILNRPSYNLKKEPLVNFQIFYKFLTNFIFLIILINITEIMLNKMYYKNLINSKKEINSIDLDLRKRNNQKGQAFEYSQYNIYKYRKFNSRNINIDDSGFRISLSDEDINYEKKPKTIWVLGASPIFGIYNKDDNTIPSLIYKNLKSKNDSKVIMKNFGVEGYTSWQSLASFKKNINLTNNKPDHIIVSVLEQDINNLWYHPTSNCDHLLNSGINSKFILERSWNDLAEKKYFFIDFLYRDLIDSFPSIKNFILSLSTHIRSFLILNLEYENFIKKYKFKRDKYLENIENCIEKSIEYSVNNFLLFNTLAKKYNSELYVLVLPDLLFTKKELSDKEKNEFNDLKDLYSLSDQQLLDKKNIKKQHITQRIFYSDQFKVQKKYYLSSVKNTLNNNNIYFLDLSTLFDSYKKKDELFKSRNHFSDFGSFLISSEIINQSNIGMQTAKN